MKKVVLALLLFGIAINDNYDIGIVNQKQGCKATSEAIAYIVTKFFASQIYVEDLGSISIGSILNLTNRSSHSVLKIMKWGH